MAIRLLQQENELLKEPQPTVETKGLNGSNRQMTRLDQAALLAQLAGAAETGDAQAFVTAYQLIDWSKRTPAEFERAIQWALTAGVHLAARSLATTGAAQYPDYVELQKAARVLAPPKVLRRNLPAEPDKRANHAWLRANRVQYRGQWVALLNGQLLATADSFSILTKQVSIAPEILFTKVI